MNDTTTAAVLAALAAPGTALSTTQIAKRLRVPLGEINAALAALAKEHRIARALVSDDGFLVCQWSLRQRRPDRVAQELEPPIAAE